MKKITRYLIPSLTVVIALVALNMLTSRHFWRVDLTDTNRYTLADATKTMLRNLHDVITVRIYFTKELPPQLSGVRRAVDDMLADYRSYGGDNFVVEAIDPQADEKAERDAMLLGIQPLQVNVVSNDKQEVAKIFLGLTMQYADKHELIPVDPRDPAGHLEEWLSGAMAKLTRAATPRIGWWGPDAPRGAAQPAADSAGFQTIRDVMARDFQVDVISGDAPIDLTQTPALMIVAHSERSVTPTQLAHLSKYLAAGGRVLLLMNRLDPKPDFSATAVTTGFEEWLGKIGVTVPPQLVADINSQYATFQSGMFSYAVPYPLWPTALQQRGGFAGDFSAVSQLDALSLPWTSPVQLAETLPDGLHGSVLVRSSERSGLTPGTPPFALDPESVGALVPAAPALRQPLVARIAGDFAAAFHVSRASDAAVSPGELIVVGSTHLLEDRFVQQREFGEAIPFALNLLDHFTVGDDLIGIRSRPVTARPIARTLSNATKVSIRMAHVVGAPLIVVALGLVGMWRRKARRAVLKEIYS